MAMEGLLGKVSDGPKTRRSVADDSKKKRKSP